MRKSFAYFAKRIALIVTALLIGLLLYFCGQLILAKNRVDDVALQVQRLPVATNSSASQRADRIKSWNRISQTSNAPPENTPLASIWRILKTKADAGDAYSSCRLGMELLRCSLHDKFEIKAAERNEKRREQASGNPNATERDWERINGLQNKYETNAAVCSGFQNTENLSSDQYMLKAALLGHEGAMQFVATMPSAEILISPGNLDHLIARREYAAKFLNELAYRGNQSALGELAFIHAGESWWNRLGLKDMPSISYSDAAVYALAMDLLHQQHIAADPSIKPFSMLNFMSLGKHLSASELEVAEAKANQLVANFPPSSTETESRKALIKNKPFGADSRVFMCRAQ